MSHPPACPQCGLENTYADGAMYLCPDCGFEWSPTDAPTDDAPEEAQQVRDAHGSPLADGDAVILVKDLKVKGAGGATLKKGTKIKGIRLVDGADGHNVDCRTDLGPMLLKSEFLKKA